MEIVWIGVAAFAGFCLGYLVARPARVSTMATFLAAALSHRKRSDRERGLYAKYRVERTDGSSAPGGKHERCEYFVLDVTHDPFAVDALKAYSNACLEDYPNLALDLLKMIKRNSKGAKAR